MNHKNNINMKKIFFAVMAFAVVVLTAGCNKDEDFMKASLSVEEVTEHCIRARCAYVPQKKDDVGYIVLRATTNQIDDEVRKALVDAYPEVKLNHESKVFLCDSLAADHLYYFCAVSYKRLKNGEVTIAHIETLGQRTLASNDGQYSYSLKGSYLTFTIPLYNIGFIEHLGYLYEDDSYQYDVSISFARDVALTAADEIGENYYNDENLVCTMDIAISNSTNTFTYYAYKLETDSGMYRGYKLEVRVSRTVKAPGFSSCYRDHILI